jgi:DNA polymerase-3 subunit gamma/tau
MVKIESGIDEAHLDAGQILELMGNVPNTVFERLMEAIGENQSATVIEEINRLLNAGNSPAQLARQFVRYLRNCLMARLGGESTELLQISPDERARAARSALLFSEEDLTRFLDVMLRTFDQLNYRQEQRFHLELGLLKLVHLQRLLPVEQFLSQLPVSGRGPAGGGALPSRGSSAASRPDPAKASSLAGSMAPVPPPSQTTSEPQTAPAVPFSPFEQDRSRKTEENGHLAEASRSPAAVDRPPQASRTLTPLEAASHTHRASNSPEPTAINASPDEPFSDSAPAASASPQPVNPSSPDLDSLRNAVCDALESNGHHTAAALLSSGIWAETDGGVQVEVGIKKTMLGLTMNPEAEKIVKAAARKTSYSRPISVLSSANGSPANASPPPKRQAAAGSVQAQALAHPLVKQAIEMFNGEVRSVVDLR